MSTIAVELPSRVAARHQRTAESPMPLGAVFVGDGSRWANPYGEDELPAAVRMPAPWLPEGFQARMWATGRFANALARGDVEFTVDEVRRELAGRELVCTCPLNQPCHADVLRWVAAGFAPGEAYGRTLQEVGSC